MGLVFFSLGWGEGGSDFYFIFWGLIPNVFPLCSHQVLKIFSPDSQNVPQVPNVLPKTFPITPHIFLTHPYVGGVTHFSRILMMGQSNDSFEKNKNDNILTVGTPPL